MSLAIKCCTKCVAACFKDIFGSKNRFQGQKNVHNGSEQSGDVPRVFVKCVGVYNSDGSVGGVYYFFC